MNAKPNFEAMTSSELKAYVLEHRQDQQALQAFLDKRRAEGFGSRSYGPEDDFGAAIDEYLRELRRRSPQ